MGPTDDMERGCARIVRSWFELCSKLIGLASVDTPVPPIPGAPPTGAGTGTAAALASIRERVERLRGWYLGYFTPGMTAAGRLDRPPPARE